MKCQRAINFDLDTKAMTQIGINTNGYAKLRTSFEKQGFEHRQGSGYISKQPLSDRRLYKALYNIAKDNLWLASCVNTFDVTNILGKFDVKSDIFNITNSILSNNNILQFNKTKSPALKAMQAGARKVQKDMNKGQSKQKAKTNNNGNYMG